MEKFFTTAQNSVATSTIENNFIVNRFFETIEQILTAFFLVKRLLYSIRLISTDKPCIIYAVLLRSEIPSNLIFI